MSQGSGDPGTLDLPYYGIGFVDAVKRAFQKYARFDGRASRGEFWWVYLGCSAVSLSLYLLSLLGPVAESPTAAGVVVVLTFAWLLTVLLPVLAVSVRRLHDAGLSGWLYLIVLIPCGGLLVLAAMALPPKPEGATYDRLR